MAGRRARPHQPATNVIRRSGCATGAPDASQALSRPRPRPATAIAVGPRLGDRGTSRGSSQGHPCPDGRAPCHRRLRTGPDAGPVNRARNDSASFLSAGGARGHWSTAPGRDGRCSPVSRRSRPRLSQSRCRAAQSIPSSHPHDGQQTPARWARSRQGTGGPLPMPRRHVMGGRASHRSTPRPTVPGRGQHRRPSLPRPPA